MLVDRFLDFLRRDIFKVREILSALDIVACSKEDVGVRGDPGRSPTGVGIEKARLMGDMTGSAGNVGISNLAFVVVAFLGLAFTLRILISSAKFL